jgi:hypothetical protein
LSDLGQNGLSFACGQMLLQESGENINTAAAATAQVFGSKFRGSDCLSSATVTVGQKRTKSAVRERIET